MPNPERSSPPQSRRRLARGSVDSGTIASAATKATTPIGTLMRKIHAQRRMESLGVRATKRRAPPTWRPRSARTASWPRCAARRGGDRPPCRGACRPRVLTELGQARRAPRRPRRPRGRPPAAPRRPGRRPRLLAQRRARRRLVGRAARLTPRSTGRTRWWGYRSTPNPMHRRNYAPPRTARCCCTAWNRRTRGMSPRRPCRPRPSACICRRGWSRNM